MPTLVILATTDPALADCWERQLPAGRIALRLGAQAFPGGTAPGFAAVIVLDAVCESALPPSLARCPTIFVGEPRSLPFEQARIAGRAFAYAAPMRWPNVGREYLKFFDDIASADRSSAARSTHAMPLARPAPRWAGSILHGGA